MNRVGRGTFAPVLIILGVLLIGSIWTLSMGGTWYMGPGMMGGGYYWGWWMPAMMLLFWGLVGVGAYILYRSWTPTRRVEPASADHSRALAIASERLAKGEITVEEYEKIKKTLEG